MQEVSLSFLSSAQNTERLVSISSSFGHLLMFWTGIKTNGLIFPPDGNIIKIPEKNGAPVDLRSILDGAGNTGAKKQGRPYTLICLAAFLENSGKFYAAFRVFHSICESMMIQYHFGNIQPQSAPTAIAVPGFIHSIKWSKKPF